MANRDIGFVQAGQDVELKLETFMFTRCGTIPGKVVSISRDAMQDVKKGLLYPARIALLRDTIEVDGRQLPLGAGMALTAEIKTDHRKVIDYLLSPIRRYGNERTMKDVLSSLLPVGTTLLTISIVGLVLDKLGMSPPISPWSWARA